MRRMGHEFELWRRLRTSEAAQKLPHVAPWWGGEGGSGPDANTGHGPLPQHGNGRQRIAQPPGPHARLSVTSAGSLHGGWGGRAP